MACARVGGLNQGHAIHEDSLLVAEIAVGGQGNCAGKRGTADGGAFDVHVVVGGEEDVAVAGVDRPHPEHVVAAFVRREDLNVAGRRDGGDDGEIDAAPVGEEDAAVARGENGVADVGRAVHRRIVAGDGVEVPMLPPSLEVERK